MSHVTDTDLTAVSRFLEPGEQVRWIGQPHGPRQVTGALPASVFGAGFAAFALFWMAGASGFTFSLTGPSGLFPLCGLPFLVAGLAMLLTPLWAWRKARRTLYVVTDRRAVLALPSGDGLTVQSLRPGDLGDLAVTVRKDGRGTIHFGSPLVVRSSDGETTTKTPPAFEHVPDVLHVKALLDDLHREAPRLAARLLEDAEPGDDATDARTPEPPAWNLSGRAGA
jgi:hypothetical protein